MAVEDELTRIFTEAARLWNARRFFDCHDKLEEAWRLTKHERKAEAPQDPRRDVIHGMILYAAAYVHWAKGNALGVARKLADARRLLTSRPDRLFGADLAKFCPAVEADLERGAKGENYAGRTVPALRFSETRPPSLK